MHSETSFAKCIQKGVRRTVPIRFRGTRFEWACRITHRWEERKHLLLISDVNSSETSFC